MESYEKLKKRTFKLTYISEAGDKKKGGKTQKVKPDDGKSTQEDVDAASQKDAEAKAREFITASKNNVYDSSKRVEGGDPYAYMSLPKGVNVGHDQEGTKPKRMSLQYGAGIPMALADAAGTPIVDSKGWKALVGWFKGGGDDELSRKQIEADAEAARYDELAAPGTIFLEQINKATGEPVYNIDQDNDNNIGGAIIALKQTSDDLKKFCLAITTKPKPRYCEDPGIYLMGQSKAAFGYKLANGKAIGPDGEQEHIHPGLVVTVAQHHRDFMKFLTGEGDCDTISKKVGTYDGKLFLFGDNQETGVVINTKNALQRDALEALKKTCKEAYKERALTGPASKGGQNLNTIRATVDEKCMIAAVKLAEAGTDPVKRDAAMKDIAAYIREKGQKLIEYAKGKVTEEDAYKTFELASEEQILMEQAKMASTDGGKPLVRYTMMTIARHMAFAKAMGADSAGDLSKGGGSGGRSDTVLYYKKGSRAKAEDACAILGLDPALALTKSEESGYAWELGVGQKDKMDKLGDAKIGEYNTNARRRASIRGELGPKAAEDKKFQEGFTEWADKLQFGLTQAVDENGKLKFDDSGNPVFDEGAGKERWDAFLKFEENLEADLASMESTIRDGKTYTVDGKIKSVQPDQACTELETIVRGKLSYDQAQDTELGKAFLAQDKDFKNAADRGRAAELIGRQARLSKVQEALNNSEDPKTQQAARDWVIRNAIMTGGNYRDIVTDITSHDDNRSLVFRHNEIFHKMTEANNADIAARAEGKTIEDTVTISPVGSDLLKLQISVGDISCKLGFEGTWSGSEANPKTGKPDTRKRETRTVCDVDLESMKRMGTIFEGLPEKGLKDDTEEGLKDDTMYQYMVGQMRLLETLINQSKSNQAL